MSTPILTVAEAATMLRVERTTIYRLIAKGELSAIDMSVEGNASNKGLTRIYESEIDELIARRTRNAKSLRSSAVSA